MNRRTIRYAAAAIATAMALIYFAIGLEVVQVVTDQPVGSSIFGFGMGAGLLFLATAAVIVLVDRRIVWAIGAILQVLIALMYFGVAPTRDPSFEIWGITLRVLQLPLFVALTYLALHRPMQTMAIDRRSALGAKA